MPRAILNSAASITTVLLAVGVSSSADVASYSEGELRAAVAKAIPLLHKGAEGHVANRTCFACHNQTMPIMALTTAATRGIPVPHDDLTKYYAFIAKFLDSNRENYWKGRGQGGQVDTAGYALLALELGGRKPDATTEAVIEYLLQRDQNLDHWRTTSHRPPSEESDFTASYLAMRALRTWGTPAQKERIDKRINVAHSWLVKTPAKDTEDRVFRLWSLRVAGADEAAAKSAIADLVKSQRTDGGWSQTEAMDSDAYATGSALVALNEAGKLATPDLVYRRGVAFLMKGQLDDGSWRVPTRSEPIQAYFESGFPHGKDQFISIAATGWATTALALNCRQHQAINRLSFPSGSPSSR